jgi:amino acid transporter
MVLQTIGRRAALVVGSLIILTYLATAVVSALSGALYLSSLWGGNWPVMQVAAVAAVPVLFFAVLNLFGLKESTKLVFGIAVFHFAMLLVMDVWGLWLAFTHGAHWERLLMGFQGLPPQAMVLGFAAAFLGVTGFESAAQIMEEIEGPPHRSIRKIFWVIVVLVSITAPLSSLLCMVLLSDMQVQQYKSAFLSGLAYVQGGQPFLILLVANACLTLFAAVNTAFAAATGLMTTMGKQGNLPGVVLNQWSKRVPAFKGYPYVAIPFMALCLLILFSFPGNVDRLGEIYGMSFLAVMIAYCIGVVLLRIRQPNKVARSAYKSQWTFKWRGIDLPYAPIIAGAFLLMAELTIITHAHDARALGAQLFFAVLLLMAFYRLGQVESRMVTLPDLRLGIGRYRGVEPLPELPTYVVCTLGAFANRLVTQISYLLKKYGEGIEIVLFHAEEQGVPHGVVSEGLERLVSQQLSEFYADKNFILSVKVLPGSLVEVLPEYRKTKHFDQVFIATGRTPQASEELRDHLSNELGLEVNRLDEQTLPKGPGVWFTQWAQGFRRQERDFSAE